MLDCTTFPFENLFWLCSTFILLILCYHLQSKVFDLQSKTNRLPDIESHLNDAIHDLYDCYLQFVNQNIQENKGALGYVYVLKSDSGHYKIGKTTDPKSRRETFGVKLPMEVEYLVLIYTHSYHQLEAKLHQQFKHKRINGE